MKKLLLLSLVLFFAAFKSQAQDFDAAYNGKGTGVGLTPGILRGGGALIGVDFEKMVYRNLALQAGFGLLAYGFGINYHLKPYVKSSYVSLAYSHQGLGDTYVQSVVGPSFNYRFKFGLVLQLGMGAIVDRNRLNPQPIQYSSDLILLYSIGWNIGA